MKYLFYFLFSIFSISYSFASNIRIVSQKDGLSSNNIIDLKIDSRNFLWIATNNGLNRFDGINNYILKPDLFYGEIKAIELIDSIIVFSNNNKLYKLNTATNEFNEIYLPKIHKQIIHLYKLNNNRLVAYSSNGGLIFFDNSFNIFSIIQLKPKNKVSISQYGKYLFVNQPYDKSRGLVRIDLNKIISSKYKLTDIIKYYSGKASYGYNQIVNTKELGLLFITTDGICYYDSKSDKFLPYKKFSNEITNIFSGDKNNMFIIKHNFQIQEYNFKKSKIKSFGITNDEKIPISKIVYNRGLIYLISNDGLIISDYNRIRSTKLKQKSLENIENKPVVRRAIVEHNNFKYFFNYSSIYKLKNNSEEYSIIHSEPIISYSAVVKNGFIYFGSEGGLLFKLDLNTDKVTKINTLNKLPDTTFISCFLDYDDNQLLIGTNKGVFKYDIKKNVFINSFNYIKHGESLVKHITRMKNGQYWVASTTGVHVYSEDLKYIKCLNKKNTNNKLCTDSVNFIFQQNDSNVWFGTYNGIQQYNFINYNFKYHFNYSNGLSNNIVIGIFKDNQKRLWVNTFNGLNILDNNSNKIYKLYKYDGLVNNEYNFNSYLQSKDSFLYLGGVNGYESIPINDFLIKKTKDREIEISEIITVNTRTGAQVVNYFPITKINYNSSNSLIRIKFTATDHYKPFDLNYQVKIVGLSDAWVDLGNNPNARFYNIPRGKYKLLFRATDKNNPYIVYEKTVDFYVKQIFYKQLWFIPGITFLAIILIIFIIYTYRKIIQTKLRLNQKLIIEQELNNALNKQKELNNMRSRFVALISHEYRTPLTAIQSSVDLLQLSINRNIEDKTERQTNYLNNIKNQIQRLVEIINGVVALNKSGDKFNDAIISPVEMKSFIKDAIKDFKINDTQCIINLICENTNEVICKIDKQTFQNAFNNILSNAVKYYYRDTEIDVTVSTDNKSNCLITIRNLGIGIIQDELEKIFEVFFRGSNVGNTPGLGTGLPMAKEFIRFNNGDIKIESYINEYVNVTITLPIYQEEKTEEV